MILKSPQKYHDVLMSIANIETAISSKVKSIQYFISRKNHISNLRPSSALKYLFPKFFGGF